MKILLIANAARKNLGQCYYSIDQKIYNGLTRNGHLVSFFSDRDVARESSIFNSGATCKRKANKKLIKTFQHFRPDLILLGHAHVIANKTLYKIKELDPAVKMAQFNVDGLFSDENADYIRKRSDILDASFITTGGDVLRTISTSSSPAYFIPNIVDSSIDIHQNHLKPHAELGYDLFHAMSQRHSYDTQRAAFMQYIHGNSENIRLLHTGYNGNKVHLGDTYFQMLGKSKMAINLSRWYSRTRQANEQELHLYSSDRISHILGNGLLCFAQRRFALEKILDDGKEAVFFDNKEDLLEKIHYYNQHDSERMKIAQAGYEKAHRCFNEKLVTQYMLDRIFRNDVHANVFWKDF